MELKLLEDFLCLNDTKNFSRAAEARNITQSTLSKRIRSMERWVGADLIDRSSNPICLTSEGQAMVPQARELVALFHGMRAGLRAYSSQEHNKVKVSSMHTLRLTFVPRWQEYLHSMLENCNLEMTGSHIAYAQTLREFKNGESNLLLTYAHPYVEDGLDSDEFESLPIMCDRVIPVSSPDTYGRPQHVIESSAQIPFLSYGTSSFFAKALSSLLQVKPLPLNVVAANAMCVGLMSLAEVGCGIAWIPESLIEDKLSKGILVPAGGSEWYLKCEVRLYRHRQESRPLVHKIWDLSRSLLINQKASVIANMPDSTDRNRKVISSRR